MSQQLIWEIVKNNSSYLVKRPHDGGARFSTDPLNVANKHSYKFSGSSSSKAIGVAPAASGKGIVVTTKNSESRTGHAPAKNVSSATYDGYKSKPKVARSIANTTKRYRPDLTTAALARASAILRSQRDGPGRKEKAKVRKPRGKKAGTA